MSCCTNNIYNQCQNDSSTTLTNVGSGEVLSVLTAPNEYNIKSLLAGSNITMTSSTTDVTINTILPPFVNSIASTGTGDVPLVSSGLPPSPIISELIAGANITLTQVGNDVEIASTGGGGITRVENAPAFTSELVKPGTENGPTVQIREISQGNGIALTTLTNEIRIQLFDFRQRSMSMARVTTQNITTTPTNIIMTNSSPPGFLFNVAVYSGNVFNAIDQGMCVISWAVSWSLPIPEAGQIFVRLNSAGNPLTMVCESPNTDTTTTGLLTGSLGVYLLTGQTATIEVYSTAYTLSTPIVRPGTRFSVIRSY